jgi:hypothetical protein
MMKDKAISVACKEKFGVGQKGASAGQAHFNGRFWLEQRTTALSRIQTVLPPQS